jgi:Holliday junction DNA helicase RuvA
MIARANGVGPKLAQRIAHELKDKAGALDGIAGSSPALSATSGPLGDAVAALTGLGFKPGEASAAVSAANEELGAGASLDALVRAALKKAAK